MSQELVEIVEPSPASTSEQDRRWAMLRWLLEPRDAQFGEILEAANAFEQFVVGQGAGQKTPEIFVAEQIAGQKQPKESPSKTEKAESTASRLVAGAADALRTVRA